MRVLGFGTYDLSRHPRAGIVLDGLRAHGDDVVEVNVPLGFSTAERVAMLGKPWLAYRLVLRLLSCWAQLATRALRERRRDRFDVVLVGYLGHFDVVLARVLFPRTVIALDMMIFAADTAVDRGQRGGLKLRLLALLDRSAVSCSDVVLVDTVEHLALLPENSRAKGVVVPVGAPRDWFTAGDTDDTADTGDTTSDTAGDTAGTDLAAAPGLRAAFFGLFTPLQGARVIGDALALLADRPDIEVTMIGSGQDLDATRAAAGDRPSTTWVPWVESRDLPRVVAAHDVCLGIFGETDKALRVVPNKVYQGAAAGCAIVTSDTAPQRRALRDAAVFVPPGDPAALAASLRELADDPARLASLRSAARAVAAAEFLPSAIVEPLRTRLEKSHR